MLNAKKPLPFPEPTLSDADKKAMEEIGKQIQRAQLLNELSEIKRLEPIYEKRQQFVRKIPKFWITAMLRHAGLALDLKNEEDQRVLQSLVDIAVQRNQTEPRVYNLEFTFSQNPFFEDRILRKKYEFNESSTRKKESADREGFKWTMLDFDWDDDVKALPCKINWKPGKNLSKKYAKVVDEDGDIDELGSFFNWFESDGDAFDIYSQPAAIKMADELSFITGDNGSETTLSRSSTPPDIPHPPAPVVQIPGPLKYVYITFINSGHHTVTVSWEVSSGPTSATQTIQVPPRSEEFYPFEAGKEYELSFKKKRYNPYKEK
ncbi:hypothetical protein CVT26_010893 [Gymnopilus dilepis]|uniref:Uncharacterized protein n=1 Tax=Gymnopilus dilepis TaxID=231916 RepID=A0A409VIT7_9AGAR|nr:hypothetical protein CVT26_010893 [Gymnopilus dilepis]